MQKHTEEVDQADRRTAARYPLEFRVKFRGLGRGRSSTGVGRSVNVSSQGIFVWPAKDSAVSVGSNLETVLEWPVLLDGVVSLQLVTTGRVVRSNVKGFAVKIDRYEFRTSNKGRESKTGWRISDIFTG